MNRSFAILNTHNIDLCEVLVNKIPGEENITVYTQFDDFELKNCTRKNVSLAVIPEESCDNEPKMRNYILKHAKMSGAPGFLHVIQDNVSILKDPSQFISDVEDMMKALDQKSWFNCSTDPVNYVYSKFNPRYYIDIDDPEAQKKFDKRLLLCSNANTSWVIYDMEKYDEDHMFLNEKFTIAMYYIIEFLARRRNSKKPGDIYYMNMYPTIESERGVFSLFEIPKTVDKKSDSEKMKNEDMIFNEMKINISPDMDIVQINEDLRNMLVS